jgi:hypothetical protein
MTWPCDLTRKTSQREAWKKAVGGRSFFIKSRQELKSYFLHSYNTGLLRRWMQLLHTNYIKQSPFLHYVYSTPASLSPSVLLSPPFGKRSKVIEERRREGNVGEKGTWARRERGWEGNGGEKGTAARRERGWEGNVGENATCIELRLLSTHTSSGKLCWQGGIPNKCVTWF